MNDGNTGDKKRRKDGWSTAEAEHLAATISKAIAPQLDGLKAVSDVAANQIAMSSGIYQIAESLKSISEAWSQHFAMNTGIFDGLSYVSESLKSISDAWSKQFDTATRISDAISRQFANLSLPSDVAAGPLRDAFPTPSTLFGTQEYQPLFKAAAMLILSESVPEEVSKSEQWRRAANTWLETHAWGLFWNLLLWLLPLFSYFMAATGGYDLIDKVSTDQAIPIAVITFVLSVRNSKKNK